MAKQRKTKRNSGNPNASKTTRKKRKMRHAAKEDRPEIYPDVVCKVLDGEEALTADQAKELLGWEEVETGSRFKDLNGNGIYCSNNLGNRPLTMSNVKTISQDILRGKWKLNCENMIIGKTGQTLNAQHRLIALIFAVQTYNKEPDKYEHWSKEPTIDTLLVLGADESDEVVNTMDTAKPRTLAEVIYRSTYFADLKPVDRKKVARAADYAVRLMWHRTGAEHNSFAPRRTHAESLEFIDRHPKLLECVKHIVIEDGDKGLIKRFLPVGSAAALLYLMSTGNSELAKYRESDKPSEDDLTFDLWDEACDFWVGLAQQSKGFELVRNELANLMEDLSASFAVRCALLISAWEAVSNGKKITPKVLKLQFETDDDGFKQFTDCPTVGGIDVGDPKEIEDITPPVAEEEEEEEEEEEPETAKPKPRRRRKKKAASQDETDTKAIKPGTRWKVSEPNEDEWEGTIVSCIAGQAQVKDDADDVWAIDAKHLTAV